jgi:hypothetical protein
MNLPPIQTTPWEHENIHYGLSYYETDEVLEYGRQCWNAAIEAVLEIQEEESYKDLLSWESGVYKLKIDTPDTVSPTE